MSNNLPTSGLANSQINPAVLEEIICSDFIIKEIDGASLLHIASEQIVRPIVNKENEQQLKYLNNGKCYSGAAGSSSEPRYMELRFSSNVSETVWTAEPIRGEGNSSILVTLFDVHTGETVISGPESSAKLEIVILKGSFDRDDWTAEEFSQNIIKEMNEKNILKGNVLLELKGGIGTLGDLSILHDKNWKPVSKLRLGARFVDTFQNIRVKEAKTNTFTMKDKRMKDNRKGVEVVSLSDNVSRLKNIGQRGPIVERLMEKNIKTIKDFLSLYFARPDELRRILGRGWSEAKMQATINHALKCKGSTALKCDAHKLVKYAFDNKEDGEGVVWDETLPPLVSPTTTTACASNGPFSFSSSSIMGEDVVAETSVGTAFLSEEERNASLFYDPLLIIKNGHDHSTATTTSGGIISSSYNDHSWNVIGENDPNNIFQVPDMDDFNWYNHHMFRIPSFSYEDQIWNGLQ
ncbi:calmodulin-binding protein 60 B-like isoform X1 [Impatiens glandulifera]|uniref:calmodulin-binding protein 60 B-like isoform X1 n=2 Tax=Impatiens glandulifera TaxID=253017 RepID=UPI001FB07B27|nr:calmodulin-binding protein 60 B-like isoform X1 [Impatiens glandulifera]